MKPSEIKKQKILTLGCKPIKLKFENMKQNIEDINNEDALYAGRPTFKDKDKQRDHDRQKLAKMEKSLGKALTNKTQLSSELIENCLDFIKKYKRNLDEQQASSSKMKFRIVKSSKKLASNNIKTDQSFSEFGNDSVLPAVSSPNSPQIKQTTFPQLKVVSTNSSQVQSPIFSVIKLKRNNQNKLMQLNQNQGQLAATCPQSNNVHKVNHNEFVSTSSCPMELKTVGNDQIIKKMKLQVRKLMNQRDEKKALLQDLNIKFVEVNKNLESISQKNNEYAAILEQKDYEIQRQKSNCRLLQAQLEKIKYRSMENKQINLTFDIEFNLNLTSPDQNSSNLDFEKQKISNQIDSLNPNLQTDRIGVHLKQTISHLQLIIVSQNQEIENLRNKWSQLQSWKKTV